MSTRTHRHPRIATAAAACALLLGPAGCASTALSEDTGPPLGSDGYTGPPVTLQYWNGFTGGDGPYMRAMVDEFNAAHDNIQVESNTLGWTDFYQRIVAAVHAGQGPDVAVMQLDNLATQAARSVIVPVEDAIEQMGFSPSDFPQTLVEATTFNGHAWGVPLDSHTIASYANTDQLNAAGVAAQAGTGAAFESELAAVQQSGVAEPFWMPNKWPAHLMFLSLLWQGGGEPYSADGLTATYNSPAGVEALSWMVDQVKRGVSPTNVAIDSQYLAFKNAETTVTWDGIWQINDLRTTAPDLKWSLAPIPKVFASPASWANSHQFVMLSQREPDADKQQAGKTFIKWMVEHSSEWAAAGMIPAYEPARSSPEFTNMPQSALSGQIENFHYMPSIPGVGDVNVQTLELAVSEAVLGRQTPQQALDQQAARADDILASNAEKFGATNQG
ncbi:ABC transporter substrate-binding protein [Actinoplanes sp. NPDC023714]|uniref:ABC transporter substrate-binding protein n=1 Tax=Actinoplanes sp. NPDC023714 TaxID=3154322 RepID=UPI00340FC78E